MQFTILILGIWVLASAALFGMLGFVNRSSQSRQDQTGRPKALFTSTD